MAAGFRTEKDTMGEMQVPETAYYAAQTQRAVENFPISGRGMPREMIAALGMVKLCASRINLGLGLLDAERQKLIEAVAKEVIEGKLDAHFPVDVFQTGSGTSSNMNTNEVIANRAMELGGGKVKVHPNDHVNMSQSSNDVFPTAIHLAVAKATNDQLLPALRYLHGLLAKKSAEYIAIVKTGRTHLMDATPITLGQEFSGYAAQIEKAVQRIERSLPSILELPLGGTAVGTGVNTPPGFSPKVIAEIAKETGMKFFEATNHFEAQAAKDGLVEFSGQLKTIACSMTKIANDLRWLGSGPRCGIGELFLPEIQPGSSIMPAKVNPVVPESVLMAMAQVIGNDTTITIANHAGSTLELNVMMPVMVKNILESVTLIANSAKNFGERCIAGLKPNMDRIHELAEANISTCTSLAPKIGYEKAAEIAKEAYKTKSSVRDVAAKWNVLPKEELDRVMDLLSMTKPGL